MKKFLSALTLCALCGSMALAQAPTTAAANNGKHPKQTVQAPTKTTAKPVSKRAQRKAARLQKKAAKAASRATATKA